MEKIERKTSYLTYMQMGSFRSGIGYGDIESGSALKTQKFGNFILQ